MNIILKWTQIPIYYPMILYNYTQNSKNLRILLNEFLKLGYIDNWLLNVNCRDSTIMSSS